MCETQMTNRMLPKDMHIFSTDYHCYFLPFNTVMWLLFPQIVAFYMGLNLFIATIMSENIPNNWHNRRFCAALQRNSGAFYVKYTMRLLLPKSRSLVSRNFRENYYFQANAILMYKLHQKGVWHNSRLTLIFGIKSHSKLWVNIYLNDNENQWKL